MTAEEQAHVSPDRDEGGSAQVEEKDIIFYWFKDEELGCIESLRIFIPEAKKFIPLAFDPIGEVYESEPHPVPLGSHTGHLQVIATGHGPAPEVTHITSQHQLLPFEVTKSRGRIIVKLDPNMKPVDMSGGITLSPDFSEVKWERNAGSSSPEHQHSHEYSSSETHTAIAAAAEGQSRTPTPGGEAYQPISIEDMLRKYQLTEFAPNAPPSEKRAQPDHGLMNGSRDHVVNYQDSHDPDYKDEKILMLEETISNLQNLNQRKTEEIDALKSRLAELERSLNFKDEALSQKQEEKSAMNSLRADNERLHAEVERLKRECDVALVSSNRKQAGESVAMAKRCEYLEKELKEVRVLLNESKEELSCKARLIDDLQQDNAKLSSHKSYPPSSPLKFTAPEPEKLRKSVDFLELSKSSQGSRSPNAELTRSPDFKALDRPYNSIEQQDSYTSNNLKFLRDRLTELRTRNEELQRRYCQETSSKSDRHSEYKPDNNRYADESEMMSAFDETDREIETLLSQFSGTEPNVPSQSREERKAEEPPPEGSSSSYHREKKQALEELERLREHLACVKSQVRQREYKSEAEPRSDAISKLKKPSDMFHSLTEKPEKSPPRYEKPTYITDAIIERPSFSAPSSKPAPTGMESDSTEVLLNTGPASYANFGPPPTQTRESRSSCQKKKRGKRSRSVPPKNRFSGRDESSSDSSSDTYRGFEADKENNTLSRYDPEKIRRDLEREQDYNDSYFDNKPSELAKYRGRSISNTRAEDSFYHRDSEPYLNERTSRHRRDDDFTSRGRYERPERTNGYLDDLPQPRGRYDRDQDDDYYTKPSLEDKINAKYREAMDSPKAARPAGGGQNRPYVPRSAGDIAIGDRIKFSRSGGKISQGTIKYVGSLPSRADFYVGVELENGEGKHDGVFQGRRYFTCKPNKGVFVSFKKIVMCYTGQ